MLQSWDTLQVSKVVSSQEEMQLAALEWRSRVNGFLVPVIITQGSLNTASLQNTLLFISVLVYMLPLLPERLLSGDISRW